MALAHPEVGQDAPDFTLTSHQDTEITLSQFRGQKNVILFFVRAPACWHCREHVEQLGRLYDQYQSFNTEVLVVIDASAEEARDYAKQTHAKFPVLANPGHTIYELYGLNKVFFFTSRSGSVVVDTQGKISYMKSALITNAWLKESLEVLDHVKSLAQPV